MTVSAFTPKGARTRDRIVSVAAELMLERGVAGTTIEQVKESAAVSASQLYHYFADKHDLVRAVVIRERDASLALDQAHELTSLAGLWRWRQAVVNAAVEAEFRAVCPLGALGSQLAENDPTSREIIAAGLQTLASRLETGLRKMQEAGEIDSRADANNLALATVSAYEGGLLVAQIQRRAAPLEAVLDTMLRVIESPCDVGLGRV